MEPPDSTAPSASTIQNCVDDLAARLDRPVLLDDPGLRPIAYSRHEDDIDPVRLHSILRRGVSPELMADAMRLGIGRERAAFWTPELPQWQMAVRLCIPIRSQYATLGYLWILDPGRTLRDHHVSVAQHCADELATVLDRTNRERLEAEHSTQLLLRSLFTEDDPTAAATEIATQQGLPAHCQATVIVIDTPQAPDSQAQIDTLLAVKNHLPGTRLGVRWLLYAAENLVLLAIPTHSSTLDDVAAGRAVQAALEPSCAAPLTMGTSGQPTPLPAARSAYGRALAALNVAVSVDDPGNVRSWAALGSWKLVSRISSAQPETDDLASDVHPAVLELLQPDRADLRTTAESYCSLGGDARETAAALHLHRSTLYYRLDRIAEITGLDPREGEARFELMLGLRVARIAHLQPAGNRRT